MENHIKVQLSAHAVQLAASADKAAPVRFSGVAYSGGIVPAYGWMGDVAIDLSTLQNADGDEIPVLIDHSASIEGIAGKGRIRKAMTADGVTQLHIDGELTQSTEAGQRIARLLAEGFPLQLSVGMSANLRETKEPVHLNGHALRVSGVFENPHIRETSFVPTGADPATSVAAFSFSRPPVSQPNRPDKEPENMTRTPEDQALIDGLQSDVAALTASLASLTAEKRVAEFSALCKEIGRDLPEGDALKPYTEMSAAAFAVFSADLRAEHKRFAAASKTHNAALFGSQSAAKAQQQQKAGTSDHSPLMQAVARMSAATIKA